MSCVSPAPHTGCKGNGTAILGDECEDGDDCCSGNCVDGACEYAAGLVPASPDTHCNTVTRSRLVRLSQHHSMGETQQGAGHTLLWLFSRLRVTHTTTHVCGPVSDVCLRPAAACTAVVKVVSVAALRLRPLATMRATVAAPTASTAHVRTCLGPVLVGLCGVVSLLHTLQSHL